MSFRVDAAVSALDMPVFGALKPQIMATPGFQSWFRADSLVREPGNERVTSWSDLAGSNASLAQPTTASKGLRTDNVINGRSAVVFDGNDFYGAASTGPVVNWAGPWTLVWIGVETGLSPSGHALMGALVDSNNRSVLYRYTDSGQLKLSQGNAEIPVYAPRGVPHCIVITNTDGVIRAMVDGGPVVRGRGNNLGAGNASLILGAMNGTGTGAMQGAIADAMTFTSDLSAQPQGLALINNYARNVYGIGV